MKVTFGADKLRINGPMADGGYKVSIFTGEYEREKVAELLRVSPDSILEVTIKSNE